MNYIERSFWKITEPFRQIAKATHYAPNEAWSAFLANARLLGNKYSNENERNADKVLVAIIDSKRITFMGRWRLKTVKSRTLKKLGTDAESMCKKAVQYLKENHEHGKTYSVS